MYLCNKLTNRLLTSKNYSMIDLSIIVPVYNVEKYVRTCIESIYRQGLDENRFELIIVNDGTKDHSMEMIADIIQQHDNIIVINQINQGLSVARNNGMAKATGEYIFMPDSDDFLLENKLEPLLDLALKSKADLVVADFLKMTSEKIYKFEGIEQQKMNVSKKSGWEMLLEELNPYECYVWRSLYRRQFIVDNNLRFISGIRFQDVPFTHEVYLKAGICMRTSWILTIYRIGRENAATNGFDLNKAKDFIKAIGATYQLINTKGLPNAVVEKIKSNIHTNITSMVYSMFYTIHNSSEKVKVIKMLRKEVPDLKFDHNILQRVESLLFRYAPHFYVIAREIIYIWKKKTNFAS